MWTLNTSDKEDDAVLERMVSIAAGRPMTKNPFFFTKKRSETVKPLKHTNLYASLMCQTFSLGTGLRQLVKTILGEIHYLAAKI